MNKRKEDFVNVMELCSDKELYDSIQKLSMKEDYIEACNYCNIRIPGYYENVYPAAEQSKKVLRI